MHFEVSINKSRSFPLLVL